MVLRNAFEKFPTEDVDDLKVKRSAMDSSRYAIQALLRKYAEMFTECVQAQETHSDIAKWRIRCLERKGDADPKLQKAAEEYERLAWEILTRGQTEPPNKGKEWDERCDLEEKKLALDWLTKEKELNVHGKNGDANWEYYKVVVECYRQVERMARIRSEG